MGLHNQSSRTGEALSHRVQIRVSEETLNSMRRLASQQDVSIAKLLVTLIKRESPESHANRADREPDPVVEELQHIRTQIWRIGHNINQIAHVVNRDLAASPDDEASAAQAVRQISTLLDRVQEIMKRNEIMK